MPFLFVDYDQGAGGEFFSAKLSESDQCVTLDYEQFDSGRVKAYDKFNQEFLNEYPNLHVKSSHENLYEIVPTHRHSYLGKQLFENIKSIRISNPIDDTLKEFFIYQKLQKVLLAKLPSKIFIGEIKRLAKISTNQNFLKEIHSSMDLLDLILLSKNIPSTIKNREDYIETAKEMYTPEPQFAYDLIIPYKDLFFNTNKIKKDIFDTFGIEIKNPWLDTYRKNYEIWYSKA
jgi:hypothetical protein